MKVPAFEGKSPAAVAEGRGRRPAIPAADVRRLLLAGVGLALVAAAARRRVLALLRPFLATRRAIAEVKRYALAERRVEDPATGLRSSCRPAGWRSATRTPTWCDPARGSSLAQPAADVLRRRVDGGAPRDDGRPRRATSRAAAAATAAAALAEARARAATSSSAAARAGSCAPRWEDGSVPMQGATVAWADGYNAVRARGLGARDGR